MAALVTIKVSPTEFDLIRKAVKDRMDQAAADVASLPVGRGRSDARALHTQLADLLRKLN